MYIAWEIANTKLRQLFTKKGVYFCQNKICISSSLYSCEMQFTYLRCGFFHSVGITFPEKHQYANFIKLIFCLSVFLCASYLLNIGCALVNREQICNVGIKQCILDCDITSNDIHSASIFIKQFSSNLKGKKKYLLASAIYHRYKLLNRNIE